MPDYSNRVFLTAEWKNLLMLNWEVPDSVLLPYLPAGLEIDKYQGKTYVSLVAFEFLNTRVMGVRIPFHTDFPEVNLRFYVKREVAGQLRRGVVFIKEYVPRLAIALTAKLLYGERYEACRIKRKLLIEKDNIAAVEYAWGSRLENFAGAEISAIGGGLPQDSEQEFLAEHYWGYSRARGYKTIEYRVEHPKWQYREVKDLKFSCLFAANYGSDFGFLAEKSPASSYFFYGSGVTVYRGRSLKVNQ